MKTIAVWTLMAAVMIVSQPSYAYGDLLFHSLLKETIEHEKMPGVAPQRYVVVSPGATAGASLGFGVSTSSCTTVTSPVKPDPAHYVLKGKVWYHLDCVVPDVAKPDLSTSTCTGSRTAGIGSLDRHTPEELIEDLNTLDQDCGVIRVAHRDHAETSNSTIENCMRDGDLDMDCVRHNLLSNRKVPEVELDLKPCTMWHPPTMTLGFGASVTAAEIPPGYVRYGTGYTHKDCVPVR